MNDKMTGASNAATRPMSDEPKPNPHPNASEKKQIKVFYGELYETVEALFFRHDPIGINFEDNTDKYSPEVSTVLPRLRSCSSVDDVQRVLHEEFTRWFGDAGPPEQYTPIAAELWPLWNDFQSKVRNA
ncbi:MAG: hypothetical protein ABJF10_27030 [Chthoniobacter sp.]|uniref:hypothetical protein n=1 Tax=Chthoniobacter sp. TaxID=2510640 RepID=UPI0032A8DF81